MKVQQASHLNQHLTSYKNGGLIFTLLFGWQPYLKLGNL